MAYINKRDRHKAIVKVKIAFGKMLGCEEDSDAEITLREPSEIEVLEWREAQLEGTVSAMKHLKTLLVNLLVSHNLLEDEDTPMTSEDVIDLIFSKNELTSYVTSEWTKAVFHTHLNKEEEK